MPGRQPGTAAHRATSTGSADRPSRPILWQLCVLIGFVVVGWSISGYVGLSGLVRSTAYLLVVTGLLAVGLLSATAGISLRDVHENLKLILAAVSVGVVSKAAIVGGFMYLIFRRPEYALLGVVMAQVDPLSAALVSQRSRMSDRAKAIIGSWASFDDPVTVLLTIYGSSLVLATRANSVAGRAASGTGHNSIIVDVLMNVAFAVTVYALWRLIVVVHRRLPYWPGKRSDSFSTPEKILLSGVLVGILAIAVIKFWMLAVAIIGTYFRPGVNAWLRRATSVAFAAAALALGLVLATGVDPGKVAAGIVLGCLAYVAHAVVSLVLTRGIPHRDRGYLALAQQNGVTAIILALILERTFPGTVSVVGPAILTVGVLYFAANLIWDHATGPRTVQMAALSADCPVECAEGTVVASSCIHSN